MISYIQLEGRERREEEREEEKMRTEFVRRRKGYFCPGWCYQPGL